LVLDYLPAMLAIGLVAARDLDTMAADFTASMLLAALGTSHVAYSTPLMPTGQAFFSGGSANPAWQNFHPVSASRAAYRFGDEPLAFGQYGACLIDRLPAPSFDCSHNVMANTRRQSNLAVVVPVQRQHPLNQADSGGIESGRARLTRALARRFTRTRRFF
jgi:hypothetical protein